MKQIGITTIIGDNYGSVLQNYALQTAIRQCGAASHLISTRPRSYLLKMYRDYFGSKGKLTHRFKFHKLQSDLKNHVKRKKVKIFYNSNVNIRKYRSLFKAAQGEKDTDILICGSDQIWNPAFQPNSLYYLTFCSGKPKYSYAASIAVDAISEKAKDYFTTALSSFSGISVREETGYHLLYDLVPNEILRVDCDPVLLLQNDHWESIKNDRYKGKRFIFLYMLRPSKELLEFAQKTAIQKGCELIFIGDYYFGNRTLHQTTDAGVEDFLSAIYYADYVITNSFHCTVFSTLFEKQFSSQVIERTGSRVRDYLNALGLQNRVIHQTKIIPSEVIDYSIVRKKITDMSRKSRLYLESIINK